MKKNDNEKKVRNALLRLANKDAILNLSDNEAGILFKGVYVYASEGVIPDNIQGCLRSLFFVLKADIDNDQKAYQEMCERNRRNGSRANASATDRSPVAPNNNINKSKSNVGEINSPPISCDACESNTPTDSFETFWTLYDKPVGNKEKIREQWSQLTLEDISAILEYIPLYIQVRPQKQFRKNPDRFLSSRTWENEPICNFINDNYGTKRNTCDTSNSRETEAYAAAAFAMQQFSIS